jgi:Family of unknown function (DUF6510)
MQPLDGNAIAGQMFDVFGAEMTMATGTCANCGATHVMAELIVYLQAPGTVGRCPSCQSVVMVVVERRETYCVDLQGLAALQHP